MILLAAGSLSGFARCFFQQSIRVLGASSKSQRLLMLLGESFRGLDDVRALGLSRVRR